MSTTYHGAISRANDATFNPEEPKYFHTGTAEGEDDIIQSAFITGLDLERALAAPAGSPRIVIGKKGSGKSALVKYCRVTMLKSGFHAIKITPDDIKLPRPEQHAPIADLKAAAYSKLLRVLCEQFTQVWSSQLTGGDQALVSEFLRAEKDLSRPKMERLVAAISRLGDSSRDLDVNSILGVRSDALARTVASSERIAYLMVDDTDQFAAAAGPGHLNSIWGFLLAVRRLAGECRNIRMIVTLRSEVWRRLEIDPHGQRDQLDHFRPLVYFLNPRRQDIVNILERRLQLAADDAGVGDGDNVYRPFFDGDNVVIPTTRDRRSSWTDFLVTRSRGRPRDVIQLVHALAVSAEGRGADRIGKVDVDCTMGAFSEGRAKDIAIEIGEECPQFLQVVSSLSQIATKSTVEDVRHHIAALPSRMGIVLRGATMSPGNDADVFRLWSLLYEAGVLNPRVTDLRERLGYRHIDPMNDPAFVSKENWNEMQKVLWEINPAYLDFLLARARDEAARDGVPLPKMKRDSSGPTRRRR